MAVWLEQLRCTWHLPITSRGYASKHFTHSPSTSLDTDDHRRALLDLLRHSIAHNVVKWGRNLNRLSIAYVFRPRLRSRLTLGGQPFPRKPWAFGGEDSHFSLRYLYRHSHFSCLHCSSRYSFSGHENAPLPLHQVQSTASVHVLSPVTSSAHEHLTSELLRTLSRVAASKPTSWLSMQLHILFHLAHALGP